MATRDSRSVGTEPKLDLSQPWFDLTSGYSDISVHREPTTKNRLPITVAVSVSILDRISALADPTRSRILLLLDGRELFLPFATFPWFRDATIEALTAVERPSAHHLYWPRLDVDLAVESIEHPDRYPLVSS